MTKYIVLLLLLFPIVNYIPRTSTTYEDPKAARCLTDVIYHEAGNQTKIGQIAVAKVVLNRVHDRHYKKSICSVLGEPGQFPNYNHVKRTDKGWIKSSALAQAILANPDLYPDYSHGARFYHGDYIPKPYWTKKMKVTNHIGLHIFYAQTFPPNFYFGIGRAYQWPSLR